MVGWSWWDRQTEKDEEYKERKVMYAMVYGADVCKDKKIKWVVV